jgi:type IV fimbrial biogenesis protein FimT
METNRGFTLVELMVAVALVAILSTLAAPSFTGLIDRSRATAQSQHLLSSLQFARTEAAKRGVRVSLCHSVAPEATTPSCGGAGSDWGTGWLVFVDNIHIAGNVAGTLDANDTLLRVGPPLRGGTIIPSASYADWVSFGSTGRPFGSGLANGNFRTCRGVTRREVLISTTGRIRPGSPPLANSATCSG